MTFNSAGGKLFSISEWIIRFAYLNLLWIVFSLLGLVLLGFFPATAAMFAVVRKWSMGYEDIPVFKSFLKAFQKDFVKANLLGYIVVGIGGILYVDSLILQTLSKSIWGFLSIPMFVLLLVCLSMMLYSIPLFVHYHMSYRSIVWNAFMIVFKHPVRTVLMLLTCYGLYVMMVKFPGLFILFGGSATSFIVMKYSYMIFELNEKRQETTEQPIKKNRKRSAPVQLKESWN